MKELRFYFVCSGYTVRKNKTFYSEEKQEFHKGGPSIREEMPQIM